VSEQRAVDSECIITYREVQSGGNNDQAYDRLGNDSSNDKIDKYRIPKESPTRQN
jgi:hypothetical protein